MRPFLVLLAALTIVSCAAPPPADGVPVTWAVLAERTGYRGTGMEDLSPAGLNAGRMRSALVSRGVSPDRILLLPEFRPGELRDAILWLRERADPDDTAFLYVFAHGSYLDRDADWDALFPRTWGRVGAGRRVLVVDACRAGRLVRAAAGEGGPHLHVGAVRATEASWVGVPEEGLPIVGGVFTFYFARALSEPGVSVQAAAQAADREQRAYFRERVLTVPEFVRMLEAAGADPSADPEYPHLVVIDAVGEAVRP